jgi:hypothetical protein
MSDAELVGSGPDELGQISRSKDTIHVSLSPKRFIGLLEDMIGEKEVLSWKRDFPFIARLSDLAQFHKLLLEKLQTQNRDAISIFPAEIAYSDNSSRTINTFSALEHLYEHKNVQVRGLSLRWEVLVDLGSERPIQRQVVRLELSTLASQGAGSAVETSAMIRIEHTHQLWATEVLAIFKAQLDRMEVHYSSTYRTLRWYGKYLRGWCVGAAGVVAVVVFLTYLASGQAKEDYWDSNQRMMYELASAIGKTDDVRKPEALAQYTFIIYVLSNSNKTITSGLIGKLRELEFFGPELEEVFKQVQRGDFREAWVFDSAFRRASIGAGVALVIIGTLSLLAAWAVVLFRSPGYILLTDASTSAYEHFCKSRSHVRELAFHLVAVAVAAGAGKLFAALLDSGVTVFPNQ